MKPLSFVLGFLPLLAFAATASRIADNGVGWGALLAFAIAAVSMALEHPAWPPKILGAVQLAIFGVMAAIGFIGGSGVDRWLFDWAGATVTLILGAFIVLTVPLMPFTEQYAREMTPREHWGTPQFQQINRVLSAAWGAAIVVMGLCSAAVSLLDRRAASLSGSHLLDLALNWAVPIGAIWYMVQFTSSYPDRVTGDLDEHARQPAHA